MVLVRLLSAPFPIQLLDNMLGKTAEGGQSLGVPAPTLVTWKELWALGLTQLHVCPLRDSGSISLSLSPFVALPFK